MFEFYELCYAMLCLGYDIGLSRQAAYRYWGFTARIRRALYHDDRYTTVQGE